jgi:hypothetical protein
MASRPHTLSVSKTPSSRADRPGTSLFAGLSRGQSVRASPDVGGYSSDSPDRDRAVFPFFPPRVMAHRLLID